MGIENGFEKGLRRKWTAALCKTDVYAHPQNPRRSKVSTGVRNMSGGEAGMSLGIMPGRRCCADWSVP